MRTAPRALPLNWKGEALRSVRAGDSSLALGACQEPPLDAGPKCRTPLLKAAGVEREILRADYEICRMIHREGKEADQEHDRYLGIAAIT